MLIFQTGTIMTKKTKIIITYNNNLNNKDTKKTVSLASNVDNIDEFNLMIEKLMDSESLYGELNYY